MQDIKTRSFIIVALSFIGFLVIAILLYSGLTIISPGYTGLVYRANGGLQEKTLSQGWHWTTPIITKVTAYSTSTEQSALSKSPLEGSSKPENFTIMTLDGKGIDVDLEFSYHYDSANLPKLYVKFKGRDGTVIEQDFIKPKLKAVTNNVSTQFRVLDIYSEKRPELNTAILAAAKEFFEPYGIVIESANITQMRLDSQTEKSIQSVVEKQQELERAKRDKAIAEQVAEKQVIQAKGEAQAAIIKAQGDADAMKILNKEISVKTLQKEWIAKWNGQVPQVQGSNGVMISLPSVQSSSSK